MNNKELAQLLIEAADALGNKFNNSDTDDTNMDTMTEGIDKDTASGLIKLGGLVVLATYMSAKAIKESLQESKKNKTITNLYNHTSYYRDSYFNSRLEKLISKSKFIKCKEGTIEYLNKAEKIISKTVSDYKSEIKEYNNFINYNKSHTESENAQKLRNILTNAKNIYSEYKKQINDAKSVIKTEWIDCDKNKICSKIKSINSHIDLSSINDDVYEFINNSDWGYKVIATDNPDYDKLMEFKDNYEYLSIDATKNILNAVKIQLKGNKINEPKTQNETVELTL